MKNNALPPERPTLEGVWRLFQRSFSSAHLQCADARFLLCELPLHGERVSQMLPKGLQPSDPPLGTLFLVDYRRPAFSLPYYEAALLIHVRTFLGSGVHCCWIVVNDDTPMIYGRETLAYPKKMAHLTFEESEDTVQARVSRRGIRLIEVKAEKTTLRTDPPPIFGATTYNVGGIGQALGINLIWRFRLTETVRNAIHVAMQLDVQESPYDPIARLITGDPMNPRMVVEDIAGAVSLFPVGIAGPRWFARNYALRIH